MGLIFGTCARICSAERGRANPSIAQAEPRNCCRWDSAPPRTQRMSSIIVSVDVVVVADHSSSFVPDFDHLCNASDPTVRSCIFWRGGVFSPEKSDTWQKDGGVEPYNGSVSNEGWDYLNSENYKGLRPPRVTSPFSYSGRQNAETTPLLPSRGAGTRLTSDRPRCTPSRSQSSITAVFLLGRHPPPPTHTSDAD